MLRSFSIFCILFVVVGCAVTDSGGKPSVVATQDTTGQRTTSGNRFALPDGWRVRVRGTATVLTTPERDSHIALVDLVAKDADAAVTAAWRAYDPVAMNEMRHFYPDEKRLELVGTAQDTALGTDALLINTEWREFRSPNFDVLKKSLNNPLVIDGRNLYEPEQMQELGFTYDCIGRPGQHAAAVSLQVVQSA